MHERIVEIDTPDGSMPVFVTQPEESGPHAPVVLFMDIWGYREMFCDLARRIGTVGYAALVPDFYYRMGGGSIERRDEDGNIRTMQELSPEEKAEVDRVRNHLSDAMAVADCAGLLDFIDVDAAIRSGPVGSMGWCMGGRHVVRVASAYPERFVASVALHPTAMVGDDGPDVPYREAPKCRGEMHVGWGEADHYSPPEVIATSGAAFRDAPVGYGELIHTGAGHGYALPDRAAYDKHAAARDWERAFAMYRRVLQA
ncbi:MAG: dienelactone hydrolase family protein [Alphaproteobacteria bacterium]|jgi:carboxymethylenebutenolidase